MNVQTSPKNRDTGSVLSAIGAWWREKMAARHACETMMALGYNDVAMMAHDLGLSVEELQDFASHGLHAADEAPRLAEALGIAPTDIERTVYTDMLRACSKCDAKRQCRHDLNAGEAEEHFEEYCLNAHTLTALRAVAAHAEISHSASA